MLLPPKTCSIDRLVTSPDLVQLVLSGKKTAMRRNGRYADPGELLELNGEKFEVTNVYRQTLGELTEQDAQAEGFSSIDDYKKYILEIHPKMPWLPHVKVWVHEFRLSK